MNRTIAVNEDVETVDITTERRTESVHAALDASLLHGWEMSRRDFVYITLTHDSGRKVRIYFAADDGMWMLMADGDRHFVSGDHEAVDRAIELMSRIGREVSN